VGDKSQRDCDEARVLQRLQRWQRVRCGELKSFSLSLRKASKKQADCGVAENASARDPMRSSTMRKAGSEGARVDSR